MQQKLISVIIPSKNIPDLLRRCLDSIARADDVEIIVVDDCSDPEKVDFSTYPGLDEPDIKVIFTKEARGAGYARNIGLKEATGQWLLFVDSDDILVEGAMDTIRQAIDNQSDIIYFPPVSADCDTLEPADRHRSHVAKMEQYRDNEKKLDFWLRYEFTEPWSKLFRHQLVLDNNIMFDESLVANDYSFSVKTGHAAAKIKFVDTPIYCVTVRQGSLCNNPFDSEEKAMSRLDVYHSVQIFFDERKIRLMPLYALLRFARKTDGRLFIRMIKRLKAKGLKSSEIYRRLLFSYLCRLVGRS